jgi:transcriptional regulator with XRE-family HTH domain
MSGFPVFREGELLRELAIRGLSQEAFARKAGVDPETVARAIRAERLKPKTFGKILEALGRIPVLNAPIDLVVAS